MMDVLDDDGKCLTKFGLLNFLFLNIPRTELIFNRTESSTELASMVVAN